eukprot:1447644-Prorocentrum_lima.AAC.1
MGSAVHPMEVDAGRAPAAAAGAARVPMEVDTVRATAALASACQTPLPTGLTALMDVEAGL